MLRDLTASQPDEAQLQTLTDCAICQSSHLSVLFELPDFPLTGIFIEDADRPSPPRFDQVLSMCGDCGHVQLGSAISPRFLYGPGYSHRSSISPLSDNASEFFLKFLESVEPDRQFGCTLEVGCNDFVLLNKLSSRSNEMIGIDPIWRDETPAAPKKARVFGNFIEELDLESSLGTQPDLIVSSHNLEHIVDPISEFAKIMDAATDDALFVIEIPSLDEMVNSFRFDQVFHQHVHYFSEKSVLKFIERIGGHFVRSVINRDHWGGSLLVAFTKGRNSAADRPSPNHISAREISDKFIRFQENIRRFMGTLEAVEGPIWGYGGGQMVPSLAYHLGTDFSFLQGILDDNPARDGLRYPDLDVTLKLTAPDMHIEDASVLITALDNAHQIQKRLESLKPKQVFVPNEYLGG